MPKTIQIKAETLVIIVLAGLALFTGGYYTRGYLATYGAKANLTGLQELESVLRSKFDGNIDTNKLVDGAKSGLVGAAGDPYTAYLNAKAAKTLKDDLEGTLSGIGAEVGIRKNQLTVISPVPGAPAAKAGLRSGDVILKINGTDPSNLSLDEAVSKIRGPQGSKVTLNISRGKGAPYDLVITRENINVPSVNYSLKNDSVGYIQLVRFGPDTGTKVEQAAVDLLAQGAKKIILDVRDNPGGYLDEATKVASQFMASDKMVVEVRRGGKTTEREYSTGGGKLVGVTTVVLINGGSASASEILAGALHDNVGAKLVGVKSFGKGSVQEIVNLAGGAELKVTIAHWYTPNGININKEGIKPNISVELTEDDFSAGRDPQLDKALELLK